MNETSVLLKEKRLKSFRPELSNHAMRIDWDRNDRKQIEDAKSYYRQARLRGRRIVTEDRQDVQAFRSDIETFIITETELKSDQFALHILDETGDRRLIWNANQPEEIEEAAKLFDEYVKKGWKPYGIRVDGTKSRRIRHFNPVAQEIFFEEKPEKIGTRLKDFVASFKEVRMLPKTTPG